MKSLFFLLFSSIFLYTQIKISTGVPVLNPNSMKKYDVDSVKKRVCAEDEMMESESSRRMEKRYISYETLRRDVVPCGTPGASYYNCRESGVANPYNRGCEVITFCARDAIINT
ncbi:putative rapid ALkalinization Factor [Helianthus anomalus]